MSRTAPPFKPMWQGYQVAESPTDRRKRSRTNMIECKKCVTLKNSDEFSKDRSSKSGLKGSCKACCSIAAKKWQSENREKLNEYRKDWRERNWSKNSDAKKESYARNRKNCLSRARKWQSANKEKEYARHSAKRAARLKAVPNWLSELDKWIISEIYNLSMLRTKITGIKWHVDHIVPLQGNGVCGLHVPWNLRVIPAKENLAKGNKILL